MKKSSKIITAVVIAAIAVIAFIIFNSGGSALNKYAEKLEGEYQAEAVEDVEDPDDIIGGYWHLSVRYDTVWYLSIYDNEAGNPGIEGPIESMDDGSVVVKYDPDYYDELPSAHWKTDGDVLRLDYECEEDAVVLTNNGQSIRFLPAADVDEFEE